MSGHSTGTGPYPTVGQAANGFQWMKGDVSDGSSLSVSSIVIASGIATVTTTTDHGLLSRQRVTVAGATPISLNGNKKITVRGLRTFQFTTTEADGTATGTITAIKVVSRKWYVVGDSRGFHLFIEIRDGIYGLCEYGDVDPFRTSTKDSIIGGLLSDTYYVCTANGGTTTHRLAGIDPKNIVVPVTGTMRTANANTSSIALPDLNASQPLDTVSVLISGAKTATIRGVYISPVRSSIAYNTGDTSNNKPFGAPSDTLRVFKTILGSPSYVGNVFIKTNGSW